MNLIILLINVLFSSELSYGPFISHISDTSAVIRYVIKEPSPSWVGWGINPKCDMYMTFFAPQKSITLPLYLLQSAREYCYKIYLPLENSTFTYIASSSTFKTLSVSTDNAFNLIIFTDINQTYSNDISSAINNLIDANTQFVIYFPGEMEIDNENQFVFFKKYSNLIRKIAFYIPVTEYVFDHDKNSYLKDFYKMFIFSYNGINPYYYYIDMGNTRLIFIDVVNSKINSKFLSIQKEWLKKNIVSSYRWTFIIANGILFGEENPEINKLSEIVSKANVDLVIQFGEDVYSRKKIITENENQINLITLGKRKENFIGENNVSDYSYITEFQTNTDGIIKLSVDNIKSEISFFDQEIKKLDNLVYQK